MEARNRAKSEDSTRKYGVMNTEQCSKLKSTGCMIVYRAGSIRSTTRLIPLGARGVGILEVRTSRVLFDRAGTEQGILSGVATVTWDCGRLVLLS